MGSVKKRFIGSLLAVMILITAVMSCMTLSVSAANDYVVSEIEQIYVNMPDIKVYLSYLDPEAADKENITAYYDDKTLPCKEVAAFSDTGDGIDYYILLDHSVSISDSVFKNIKDAVKRIGGSITDKDRLTLLVFGEEVKEIYRSDNAEGKTLSQALDKITATSGATSLYSALAKMTRTADSNISEKYPRRECILFTDGYDEAVGKETMEETKAKLLKSNIPIHTISAVNTSAEYNQKLGELSRLTGGSMSVPQDAGKYPDMVDYVMGRIYNSSVLVFRAGTNLTDENEKTLSIKFENKKITLDKKVYMFRWQPDTVAPEILKAELEEKNTVRVYFSEEVMNADRPDSYAVKNSSGTVSTPSSAVYEIKDGQPTAVLTFDSDIVKGDYTVSCKNICDMSMEKNNVSNEVTAYFDGVEPPNEFVQFLLSWQGIILAAAVLIVAVILVIILIRTRKKSSQKDKAPVSPVQQAVPIQPVQPVIREEAVSVPQEVVVNKIEKKAPKYVVSVKETNTLFVRIQLSSGESSVSEVEFEKQLIVGRGSDCDVCIDDRYMARKQFMIEKEDGNYYVSDLQSTNGTSVNGIRITSRHRLEKNDIITAGTIKMTVSWN